MNITGTSLLSVPASEQKIQLLPLPKFYETLFKLKVKKGASESANLTRFLRQGKQNIIIVKKLVKVIEEFLRNHYLKSFGYSKKRLDAEGYSQTPHKDTTNADEEEYYDEELEDVDLAGIQRHDAGVEPLR